MTRSLLSAASLLLLAGLGLSQSREQGPPVPAPIQGPSIKVESRIVVVDVVFTDKEEQSVPGLRKADFHLSEDGGALEFSETLPSMPANWVVRARNSRLASALVKSPSNPLPKRPEAALFTARTR